LKSLKDLDVNHANKLSETAASVRELIKSNISKNKETVKKVAEKLQVQFDKAAKIF
jgi:gas vesicle protein